MDSDIWHFERPQAISIDGLCKDDLCVGMILHFRFFFFLQSLDRQVVIVKLEERYSSPQRKMAATSISVEQLS